LYGRASRARCVDGFDAGAGGVVAALPAVLVKGELESGLRARVLKSRAMPGSALRLVHRGGRFLPR
jgi:hypothetical protein